MVSIFGFYFINTMLKQTGWPKRHGLFRTEVVATFIADALIDQMIDWAAALGACRPKLALQVIALMLKDRDWEGKDAPEISVFINGAKDRWNTQRNKSPHEIIEPIKLSKSFGTIIKYKDLKDNRICAILEQFCLMGLLWGLANPDQFKFWYESDYKNKKENFPLMQKAGLQVNSIPTLSDFLKESERMLEDYESEVNPLPLIPSKLLADARALGRDINS
jgi:hypothetical protein